MATIPKAKKRIGRPTNEPKTIFDLDSGGVTACFGDGTEVEIVDPDGNFISEEEREKFNKLALDFLSE